MLLELENLCKYFYTKEHFYAKTKRVVGFENISFTLAQGAKLNLRGANGSGKSTLVKTIAMLNDFDSGTLRFDGRSLGGLSFEQRRALRDDIILVMQNQKSALNPHKSIRAHMQMIEQNYQTKFDMGLLERFYLAPSILDRYAHEISGGQAQIIGLIRALMIRPRLLIVDEVDAGLDRLVLGECIRALRDYEHTLILISHDNKICSSICDSTYHMPSH